MYHHVLIRTPVHASPSCAERHFSADLLHPPRPVIVTEDSSAARPRLTSATLPDERCCRVAILYADEIGKSHGDSTSADPFLPIKYRFAQRFELFSQAPVERTVYGGFVVTLLNRSVYIEVLRPVRLTATRVHSLWQHDALAGLWSLDASGSQLVVIWVPLCKADALEQCHMAIDGLRNGFLSRRPPIVVIASSQPPSTITSFDSRQLEASKAQVLQATEKAGLEFMSEEDMEIPLALRLVQVVTESQQHPPGACLAYTCDRRDGVRVDGPFNNLPAEETLLRIKELGFFSTLDCTLPHLPNSNRANLAGGRLQFHCKGPFMPLCVEAFTELYARGVGQVIVLTLFCRFKDRVWSRPCADSSTYFKRFLLSS